MNKYSKVMNKISVTPEMNKRIIDNINNYDFNKGKIKTHKINKYKKYKVIAASLIICILSTVLISNIKNTPNNQEIEQIPSRIIDYNSNEELSSNIGFKVKEIRNHLFNIEEINYISFWDNTAEIIYSGQDNEIIFRMAVGDDDISGDYNEYEEIKNYNIKSNVITLKGSDGLYNLAIWQDDEYSYSLYLSKGMTEEQIYSMIESIE